MVSIRYENDCVGCPQGCINCGRKHSLYPEFICDKCEYECDKLYDTEVGQICEDCLKTAFDVIDEDNYKKYVR